MSTILIFQSECRIFLKELFATFMKKCPIKNSLVRAASAFDAVIAIWLMVSILEDFGNSGGTIFIP